MSVDWSTEFKLSSYCDQGNFRQSNEDTFTVSELRTEDGNSILMLGIFDGHGGLKCSKYLEENLPSYLNSKIPTQNISEVKDLITESFKSINNQFLADYPDFYGGSCAIMGLLIPEKNSYTLLTANVGDSKGILLSDGKIKELNKLHKPNDPKEQEFIENNGGMVHGGRLMGLAVSRAFGNKDLVNYGLRVKPEFTRHELTDDDTYVVYASDGIWDVMSNTDVFDFIGENENQDDLAKKLCLQALEKNSMDNVTAIVVGL